MKSYVDDIRVQFNGLLTSQFTNLIVDQFIHIETTLNSLNPFKRRKRWDSLGTVWKFIAGSPDANDLRLINTSINNLIMNNNQQIRINREINSQIKEYIFKTREAIDMFNSKSIDLHAVNIFLNLKYLSERLDDIKDTIALAKLGVLNEKILSKKEIGILIEDLVKENITVRSAWEAVTYTTATIATNSRELVLLIKLPKLDPRVFNKIHVYPILQNDKEIHLTRQMYITHQNSTYIVKSLQPNIFNLDDVELDRSTCLPNLLTGKQTICNYTENPLEAHVMSIDNQHILVNTNGGFLLKSNCGITDRNLTGSYLISYENCDVYINDTIYSTQTKNLGGKPIHIMLDGIRITKQNDILNLSMQHLHNLHLETRKELQLIKLNSRSLTWPHWTFTGSLSLPIIIIGLVFSFKFLLRRKNTVQVQIERTPPRQEEQLNIFRHLNIPNTIRMDPHL